MPARSRAVLASSPVLAMLITACIGSGDCGFEPIGASIRPPPVGPFAGDALGQCGRWVKMNGGEYWTESMYDFELEAAALEPLGEADEVAEAFVTPLAGSTTYEIPGVDPNEAIAMEAADGTYVVFTRTSDAFPPGLCPMLAQTGNPDRGPCD